MLTIPSKVTGSTESNSSEITHRTSLSGPSGGSFGLDPPPALDGPKSKGSKKKEEKRR